MSRWSTGAVGPQHRAVMRDGVVLAVAESTEVASEIVRSMNEWHTGIVRHAEKAEREMAGLKARIRKQANKARLADSEGDPGWDGDMVSRWIEEVLDVEPE